MLRRKVVVGSKYLRILLTTITCLSSCSKKHELNLIPAGSPFADWIHFRYAVYVLPRATKDPSVVLHEALTKRYTELKLVDAIPERPTEMVVHAHLEKDVQREYSPPSLKSLTYSGHGLSPKQAQAIQESHTALILDFAHPREKVWTGLRTANALLEEIASKTGGLVWDEETRDLYSAEAWHKTRLDSWMADTPDISTQTAIQIYQNGEYARAITLGMAKAGLPDVLIQELPWSAERQAGDLINIFSQSMVEGTVFSNPDRFKLELRRIKNHRVVEFQSKGMENNASGSACLSLRQGNHEEGDPNNRIIQLTFGKYDGPDIHAQEDAMLSLFFGTKDSAVPVTHTVELLEASRKAKSRLPELHKAFAAGLQPGEYIQVKAPFPTSNGGHEWMWVEITSWNGSHIKGLLMNEPVEATSWHSGQIVDVREEETFDYIRQYPDKRREGNTTGDVIKKMEEQQAAVKRQSPPPDQRALAACDHD
jgi:uncharacterized protein YegJ (DUF2314 family)